MWLSLLVPVLWRLISSLRDAATLALQTGHTTTWIILFTHYREAVAPEDAEEYGRIKPAPGKLSIGNIGNARLALVSLQAYLESSQQENMSADRLKRITVEEGKCGGRPCIRGKRIRVTDILELLASGASFNEILADYSFLDTEDIYAAIEYAAHQADHTVLQAL